MPLSGCPQRRSKGFASFIVEQPAYIDSILYDYYPNYLPGELDEKLDILRFFRMLDAKLLVADTKMYISWLENGAKMPEKMDGEADAKWLSRQQEHYDKIQRWNELDQILKDHDLYDHD